MPNQISSMLLDAPGTPDYSNAALPCPELAGRKIRLRGATPIYLIDPDGYRRLIPFPLTFMNLFKDSSLLEVRVCNSVEGIIAGEPFDEGSVLLRGRSSEKTYLLDRKKKRLIPNLRTMHKYEFNEEAVVVVPQIVVDAIPDGDLWE